MSVSPYSPYAPHWARATLALNLVLVAFTGAVTAQPGLRAVPSTPPVTGKARPFVIGTFVQSTQNFATWKARGINTLVEVPQGWDLEPWNAAAVAADLYMIRPPRSNPALDAYEKKLLAWAHEDEPSNVKPGSAGVDYSTVNTTPKTLDERAAKWRAALPAGVDIPIYLNLTGSHVTDIWINEPMMRDYVDSPSADIIAHDIYQINGGQPMLFERNGYTTTAQGHAIDRLSSWSGGKPQYAFIESSDFDSNGTLPTAGEMRAQIWSSVIHGAVGIIYFPIVFNPWSFDGTPKHLVAEMTAIHAKIRAVESTLMNSSTGRPNGTLLKMASPLQAVGPGMLPHPFEGRSFGNGKFIVLNASNANARLTNPIIGVTDASFAPYEVLFIGFKDKESR